MKKDWYTSTELVELNLPGLPATKSGVIRFAKREGWNSRKRQAQGGGYEYSYADLPDEAKRELEYRAKCQLTRTATNAPVVRQKAISVTELTARQRQVMEARAAILLELDRRVLVERKSRNAAIAEFIAQAKLGMLDGDLASALTVANGTKISRATVYNWVALREKGGVHALAPDLTRKPEPLPSWFGEFFAHYAKPQKPTIPAALANWQAEAPDRVLPTARQIKIALDKLGSVERLRGRLGAQELKTVQAYKTRDVSDLLPSSVYVADGKTYDAEIAHPSHHHPFRPELTTIIDAHTRKITGWSADLDENRFAVLDALRVACCYAGIPALFYTDNGPGYVNDTMTNPLTGFMARLSITPMRALPYNSQAKGIVERLNRMWSEDAKQYDTYIGKEMDKQARQAAFKKTRKEIKQFGSSATLPTWDDFIANCMAAIDRYNNTPHSGLSRIADPETGRQRHMTPNEAWDLACSKGFEPVLVSQVEADDLFRPWVIRKVSRCMVNWIDNSYFSLDLEQYHGKQVIVAYDIRDAKKVWVREINLVDGERQPGRLIAVAEFEGNKTRYVPVSYERQAMEKRAKGRAQRLANKLDVVEQELRPAALLELQANEAIIDINPRPEPLTVVPSETQPQAPKAAAVTANGRPRFSDDAELAHWLLSNPEAVTAFDRNYITSEVFRSHSAKEHLRMSGVDLEALASLLRSAA